MIVSREEVMARFYKVGSTAAAIGAIHILTLLLAWYVQTDAGSITELAGYVFPESLMLSLIGGLMAGIGLLLGHVLKRLKSIKYSIGALTVIGGLMAISSPIYAYLQRILAFGIKGYPTIGFFAAIFTGVIQLGVGSLALLTPIKEEVVPVTQPPAPAPIPTVTPAPAQPPIPRAPTGRGRGATTRILPAPDLEEAVCSICYEPIPAGEAMRCMNCDAVFHRGCIEAWLSLNGTCPICKAVVVG